MLIAPNKKEISFVQLNKMEKILLIKHKTTTYADLREYAAGEKIDSL